MINPIKNIGLSKALFAVAVVMAPALSAEAESVVFHSPESFQVLAVSANGKWACGAFVDAAMDTYGFRWDLESGEIEMLGASTSLAWGVANDGTVSGEFPDTQVSPNGAPVTMPGYWRDGAWHNVEMPEGVEMEGIGCGISPDGHYMTGSVKVNGHYTPYIWKDGKIHRSLDTGKDAVSYAVSPDGQSAAGFSTQYNRTACYWGPEGQVMYFTDSNEFSQGPWNYSRNFSPDGKKLLYWGGWEAPDEETLFLYTVYDIETGERTRVQVPGVTSDLEFFGISNSGLLTGASGMRGYVWSEGECVVIDEYLKKRGVDLTDYEDFYSGGDYYVNQLPISRVVSVSADDSVFALSYYNQNGQMSSMIVKIGDDFSLTPPPSVNVTQLEGLSTVNVSWKRPVGVSSIRGFNVYRDGAKVSGFLPITNPYFFDRNVAPGTYEYQVATVNMAGVETRADGVSVTVVDPTSIHRQPMSAFSRKKGIDAALVGWEAPLSNTVHQHYFNPDNTELSNFYVYEAVEVEMAVRYDKATIANYAGYKLSEVTFCPMAAHEGWAVNVYTRDADGALKLLCSQPITQDLEYKALNTVKIKSEVLVPNDELIVAIAVMGDYDNETTIAAQNDIVKVGYSDLLRMTSEADFYSAFERSAASGMSISSLSWAIDLGLEAPDYDASANAIDSYRVYLDGSLAGTTDRLSYVAEDLTDGEHLLGVEAVYANGAVSPVVETSVNILARYPKVSKAEIATNEGSSVITASWNAPVDNDQTDISYVTAKCHDSGIRGVESNEWAIMVRADYPKSMFRGYEGYQVKNFRFYPLANAIFTMILFENGRKIYDVDIEDYTLEMWNEVQLPDFIEINPNSSYTVILDCFNPDPDTPLVAIDKSVPRPMVSDLYSIDNGDTWNSLSIETGARGSWMIGMTIEDPEAKAVNVDGYDVVIDNVCRNDSKVFATEFDYDLEAIDARSHSVRIDTYYPAQAEAVKGGETIFRLPSGLADGMITSIALRRGENWLIAEGDGVTSLTVNSIDGKALASAKGNKVDISSLPTGVYVVQVYAGEKVTTRKVSIKH